MSESKVDGTEKAKDVKLVHISREPVREVRLFFLTETEKDIPMLDIYEIREVVKNEGWTIIVSVLETISILKSEDVMLVLTLVIPFEGNAQEKRLWEVLNKIAVTVTDIKEMVVIMENVMHKIEVERK